MGSFLFQGLYLIQFVYEADMSSHAASTAKQVTYLFNTSAGVQHRILEELCF